MIWGKGFQKNFDVVLKSSIRFLDQVLKLFNNIAQVFVLNVFGDIINGLNFSYNIPYEFKKSFNDLYVEFSWGLEGFKEIIQGSRFTSGNICNSFWINNFFCLLKMLVNSDVKGLG